MDIVGSQKLTLEKKTSPLDTDINDSAVDGVALGYRVVDPVTP
jgi:hypothetical protein